MACCCQPCSGPCDQANPCPPGCSCVNGYCVPSSSCDRACFTPDTDNSAEAGDCDPGCTCICQCTQTIVKPGNVAPPDNAAVFRSNGFHDGYTEVELRTNGYGTDCDSAGKSYQEQFNPSYCPIQGIWGDQSDVDINQQLIGNETGDGVIEVSGNDIPANPPPPPGFPRVGWKIVNGPFVGWYFIDQTDAGVHVPRCYEGTFP